MISNIFRRKQLAQKAVKMFNYSGFRCFSKAVLANQRNMCKFSHEFLKLLTNSTYSLDQSYLYRP